MHHKRSEKKPSTISLLRLLRVKIDLIQKVEQLYNRTNYTFKAEVTLIISFVERRLMLQLNDANCNDSTE